MRDGRDLVHTLTAAIADASTIDWTSTTHAALSHEERDLARQLRIIAAMAESRQMPIESLVRTRPDPWLVGYAGVLALAFVKVIAAVMVAYAVAAGTNAVRQQPSIVSLAVFGAAGIILIAGGATDMHVRMLGVLFLKLSESLRGCTAFSGRAFELYPSPWLLMVFESVRALMIADRATDAKRVLEDALAEGPGAAPLSPLHARGAARIAMLGGKCGGRSRRGTRTLAG